MLSIFLIVLPIFAIIFAGFAARRSGVMGPNASGELNRFVVHLALPALLFDIVAKAKWADLWQPGFVAAFGLGVALIFVATVGLRCLRGRPLADAAIDGLNAAYANTGFLGFPLALATLGPASLTPTLIASIITICILFAIALILVETGLQAGQPPLAMARKVGGRVVRNPIVIAPSLGAVVMALGWDMPAPAESFLKLLGGAAPPCALVALGLFLGEKRGGEAPAASDTGALIGLKLFGQPALTWLLARFVFPMPAPLEQAAVLIAALPTGTGPFMIAEYYRREAAITARVVLISTIVSLLTVTAYLSFGR